MTASESGGRLIPIISGNTLHTMRKQWSAIGNSSDCVTKSAVFVFLKRTT